MHAEDNLYKEIIENLYDGVYFVNLDRVITYWNKGAERLTGYTREQVIGKSCRDNLLNHVTAEGVNLCESHCPLAACMDDGNTREADVYFHHADGHRVPTLVRGAPLRNEAGHIIGAVEIFSAEREGETLLSELRMLRHSAHTDLLTGIGNRRFLEGRLRAALAEFAHQPELTTGLLMMDIDHFKRVNDTYGHETGDQALKMVSATLRHNLRASDVVGRWGGEEFLVILYHVTALENLSAIADKLRRLVAASRLDGVEGGLSVTLSIGATLLHPSDTPESVVQRADGLMYRAKHEGRNRVQAG